MKKIIILYLLFNIYKLFASVDYIVVNHITRQLAVFETGNYTYLYKGLFWQNIYGNESEQKRKIKILLSKGYKYTKFTYTLDIILILLVFIIIFFINYKIKKGRQ